MENIDTSSNLIEIETLAIYVFGSKSIADDWLNNFNDILGDTPLNLINTHNGANEIKKILHAIIYGGVV